MNNQWIIKPKPAPNAQVKLLCFPYAGGGVSVYYPWKDKLPEDVELNIVQLPGRGTQFAETPIAQMKTLVSALLPKVVDILQGNYIIFGHSVGTRIAFELVRLAVSKGFAPPEHFFASGSSGPGYRCLERKVSNLSEQAFLQEIKEMEGTPEEVLQNADLMELLLPTLRADFNLAEEHQCQDRFTIASDVTVISGRQDNISAQQLNNWGDFFQSSNIKMSDGGHFFIDTHPEQVLQVVSDKLEAISEPC